MREIHTIEYVEDDSYLFEIGQMVCLEDLPSRWERFKKWFAARVLRRRVFRRTLFTVTMIDRERGTIVLSSKVRP